MLFEKVNDYLKYNIDYNESAIKQKIEHFNNFRTKEEILKYYQLKVVELDKVQKEVNLSIFEDQYKKFVFELLDFNPNNIEGEIQKIQSYIYLLESIKEEYNGISMQMESIEKSWNKFVKRNNIVLGTFFEDFFKEKYQQTLDSISNSSFETISNTQYSVSMLQKELNKIIEIIEQLNIYKNLYVFIGEEALLVKNEFEKLFNIQLFNSKKEYIDKTEEVFSKIKNMYNNSKYGTVGLKTIKAIDRQDSSIFKYTVSIDNKIIKHDPFFNNKDLIFEDTNEYIYFENFPYSGVFKGKEIVENLSVSDKYISVIYNIRNKITNYFRYGIGFLLFLSFFGLIVNNVIFNIIILLFTILFFGSMASVLKKIIKIYERKNKMKSIFLFTQIDFGYIKFGHYIDIRLIIQKTIELFDTTILNKNNKEKLLWVETYQLTKTQS